MGLSHLLSTDITCFAISESVPPTGNLLTSQLKHDCAMAIIGLYGALLFHLSRACYDFVTVIKIWIFDRVVLLLFICRNFDAFFAGI